MDGISIIICCYNSELVIKQTLLHLIQQKVPQNFLWEIIIVNNNCTDNTEKIAIETLNESSIDYKLIKEEKAGLVHARIKGVKESSYQFIIFCDDDNLLCNTYIYEAYQIMKNNEGIGACGGMGIPQYETTPTKEIKKMQGCYALGSQKNNRYYLYGAGLCIRKKLYENIIQLNIPLLLTGRKEKLLLAGDDSEICKWIILMGYQLVSSDSLTFIHIIQKKRLNNKYLKSIIKGIAYSEPILSVYNSIILKKQKYNYHSYIIKNVLLLGKSILLSIIDPHYNIFIYNYYYTIKGYLHWKNSYLKSIHNNISQLIRTKKFKTIVRNNN